MRTLILWTTCLCIFVGVACALPTTATTAAVDTGLSQQMRDMLQFDYKERIAREKLQLNEPTKKPLGEEEPYNVFHYDVATALFWHSVSAYCTDDPSLQDWTCTSCKQFGDFTITQIMADTDNQGYVGYFTQGLPASPIDDGTGRVTAGEPFVVISFRGTVPSDLNDWIEDLNFSKFAAFDSNYPDVGVHEGFWDAYNEMKPKMLTGLAVAIEQSGATTILLTGHSLGGAMTELAAVDLKLNVYPYHNYASYTQGCPRVGNEAFNELLTSMLNVSFREIHQADIVPHLPPLLLNFRHAPMEIWYDEAFDSYQICNSTMDGEDPNCSNSLGILYGVSDHLVYRGVDMGNYCTSNTQATTKAKDIEVAQPPPIDAAPVTPIVAAPVTSATASVTTTPVHVPRPKIILTEF